jgi:hypothetical protein
MVRNRLHLLLTPQFITVLRKDDGVPAHPAALRSRPRRVAEHV